METQIRATGRTLGQPEVTAIRVASPQQAGQPIAARFSATGEVDWQVTISGKVTAQTESEAIDSIKDELDLVDDSLIGFTIQAKRLS